MIKSTGTERLSTDSKGNDRGGTNGKAYEVNNNKAKTELEIKTMRWRRFMPFIFVKFNF